jgi:hypothetical protein
MYSCQQEIVERFGHWNTGGKEGRMQKEEGVDTEGREVKERCIQKGERIYKMSSQARGSYHAN